MQNRWRAPTRNQRMKLTNRYIWNGRMPQDIPSESGESGAAGCG